MELLGSEYTGEIVSVNILEVSWQSKTPVEDKLTMPLKLICVFSRRLTHCCSEFSNSKIYYSE